MLSAGHPDDGWIVRSIVQRRDFLLGLSEFKRGGADRCNALLNDCGK